MTQIPGYIHIFKPIVFKTRLTIGFKMFEVSFRKKIFTTYIIERSTTHGLGVEFFPVEARW